jgi:phenylpropionate dioxygenase-like ring-hydroxylating dioxygenase large terminal subunit
MKPSNRACINTLPVRIATGLLWVWPDNTQDGVLQSTLVQPATVDDMASADYNGVWYHRDQPYGYDTLIENLGGMCVRHHACRQTLQCYVYTV